VPVVNQDAILVAPDLGLYAVLDGMGGHPAGDVASRTAAAVMAEYMRMRARSRRRWPRQVLDQAIRAASEMLYWEGQRNEHLREMGTTVVACLVVDPTHVVIAHVGDSRAYLLRAGKLAQLTRDHSLVQERVDRGELTPRSARRSRKRHTITRSVGHRTVRPDVRERRLRAGDRLLLCSDGLHGYTPARLIRRVLEGDGSAEELAQALVDLALSRPAPDNVSAVVIAVGGAAPRARRSRPAAAASRARR